MFAHKKCQMSFFKPSQFDSQTSQPITLYFDQCLTCKAMTWFRSQLGKKSWNRKLFNYYNLMGKKIVLHVLLLWK
jgi:hypothetical protein